MARQVAEFIDVDRSSLWELDPPTPDTPLYLLTLNAGTTIDAAAGEMSRPLASTSAECASWPRVPAIPPEAIGEAPGRRISAKSALCIPMSAGPVVALIVFTCR